MKQFAENLLMQVAYDAFPKMMPKKDVLPEATETLLQDWEYKSCQPQTLKTGPVVPTVAFLTLDVKLPRKGATKVLELNGTNSGLSGYDEENGEDSIRERQRAVCESLGVPMARYYWNGDKYIEIDRFNSPFAGDHFVDQPTETSDLTDFESSAVRSWLTAWRSGENTLELDEDYAANLTDAAILIELMQDSAINYSDDPIDAVITNPKEVRVLEADKLVLASVCTALHLDKYRPRSSRFYTQEPLKMDKQDLRHSRIGKVVLKDPFGVRGEGVTVMDMSEFKALTTLAARHGSWTNMLHQLRGTAEGVRSIIDRELGTTPEMILEEYIPSKPITSAYDGKQYDATMRLAVAVLANKSSVTTIPLGGYWKLPMCSLDKDGRTHDIFRSDVETGGCEPVNEADFKRAFADCAKFMGRIISATRRASPVNTDLSPNDEFHQIINWQSGV